MVSVSLQNNCIEDSLRLQFNSNDGQQELSLGLLILFWFYYKIFCSCLGFIFNFNFIFHAFKVVNICIQQIKYKNLYKNIDFNIMISNMQLWGIQKKKKKKQIFLLAILRNISVSLWRYLTPRVIAISLNLWCFPLPPNIWW